jgi:ABC-type enterobactin transport system permease subunit
MYTRRLKVCLLNIGDNTAIPHGLDYRRLQHLMHLFGVWLNTPPS